MCRAWFTSVTEYDKKKKRERKNMLSAMQHGSSGQHQHSNMKAVKKIFFVMTPHPFVFKMNNHKSTSRQLVLDICTIINA